VNTLNRLKKIALSLLGIAPHVNHDSSNCCLMVAVMAFDATFD